MRQNFKRLISCKIFVTLAVCALSAYLAACGSASKSSVPVAAVTASGESFKLRPVAYRDLQNWRAANSAPSFRAFGRSCRTVARRAPSTRLGKAPYFGTAAEWNAICQKQKRYSQADARRFFEENFLPVKIETSAPGLFTGYYEPVLSGSYKRDAFYRYPLFAPPAQKGGLPSRGDIVAGALAGKARPILWVSSEVDSFFLHIQGSGRAVLPDGRTVKIAYAGQNGHKYYAIGKYLIDRGYIPKSQMSAQAIRDWLEKNPDRAQTVMNMNPSYIFFALKPENAPVPAVGAAGVPLTPEYSLAVDRKIYPFGAPIWVETSLPPAPENGNRPMAFHRLMIAQDTGGAIKGPVRGDVFWGAGDYAERMAGRLKHKGEKYILLPRAAVLRAGV